MDIIMVNTVNIKVNITVNTEKRMKKLSKEQLLWQRNGL